MTNGTKRLEPGLWAHLKNQPNVVGGATVYPVVEILAVDGQRVQVRRRQSRPRPPFWVNARELGQMPIERLVS